ncbi:hypothetical protein Dsin_004278 [Dipteronia sinensis]|uniref:Reverse transcriptase zinc-binding domain-containing protein n=1 Tax=Dipteronia sinensis TaxID=43782 RepID=A0AAE0B9P6_9ROSI|nr:hypothetical protein Dsin_004278 [Dipteronia sinensis]
MGGKSPLFGNQLCVQGIAWRRSPFFWNCCNNSKTSHFSKAIYSLLTLGSTTFKILVEGMLHVLGCGDRMIFWKDIRWDNVPLNQAFQKIFALATSKKGAVEDFGCWAGGKWEWEIQLRMQLFDWEREQWSCLKFALQCVVVRRFILDSLGWNFSPDGLFSVKSFCHCLEGQVMDDLRCYNLLWSGVCHLKVQIFVWQLIRDKVLVRKMLHKCIGGNGLRLDYPLCHTELESVEHPFFLLYKWTWRLWSAVSYPWDVQFCVDGSVKRCVEG